MKRCFFFLLVAVFSAISPLTLSAQWHKLNVPAPYSTNYWLDIFFLPSNSNLGWVCGYSGMVIRTTDAGATWQGTQIPNDVNHLEKIQFLNANVGYTSGPAGIFKSTDGGVTWSDITPNGTSTSWGCYFADVNTGVFLAGGCGVHQQFFRTTNGGASWSVYIDSLQYSGLAHAILYSPNGLGYVVSSGFLWQTTNGGVTWQMYCVTGSGLWQEQLSIFGNTILVPFAGTDCAGQGTGGGMRISHNHGSSWSESSTGQPMFGTFLIDSLKAWSCGFNAAVYYTADGGQTWQLRNCGITGSMDNIKFVNENLGYVVGDGVYQLGGTSFDLSKYTMDFGTFCFPSAKYDTLWIHNRTFFPTTASVSISGSGANQFSVTLPATPTFTVSPCDSVRLVVKFQPTSVGTKSANGAVNIPGQSSLTFYMGGIAQGISAVPVSTTLTISSAPCGMQTTTALSWTSTTGSVEIITQVARTTGSSVITAIFASSSTLSVGSNGAILNFIASPKDTGWVSARFRVHLSPCERDTFIVVQAYGISPIINTPDSRFIPLSCKTERLDTILVSNTGNAPLIIPTTPQFIGSFSTEFSVIGWRSGNIFPRTLAVGSSDAIIIRYRPATTISPVSVILQIINNDSTSARGRKNPVEMPVAATQVRATYGISSQPMNFGDGCVGSGKDMSLVIFGDAYQIGTALLKFLGKTGQFSVNSTLATVPAGGQQLLILTFKPTSTGKFIDTLRIQISPCDTTFLVPLSGVGNQSTAFLSPDTVTLKSLKPDIAQTVSSTVYNNSANTEYLSGVDFVSGSKDITWKVTGSFPIPLNPNSQFPLQFVVSANDTGWVSTQFRVKFSPCGHDTIITIRAFSTSPILYVKNTYIGFVLGQCDMANIQKLEIQNQGNDDLIITSATIVGAPTSSFSIQGWTSGKILPITIPPSGKDSILIQFSTNKTGPQTDTLKLGHNDFRVGANLPHPFPDTLWGEKGIPVVKNITFQSGNINFDSLCVGDSKEIVVTMANVGTAMTTLTNFSNTFGNNFAVSVEGKTLPFDILVNDTIRVHIRFQPSAMVQFNSSPLIFEFQPCNLKGTLYLTGTGRQAALATIPASIDAGQFRSGTVKRDTFLLKSTGNTSAVLKKFDLVPNRADWTLINPPIGKILAPGATIPVVVEFFPTIDTSFVGQICVSGDSVCTFSQCFDVKAQSVSAALILSKVTMDFGTQFCGISFKQDTVLLSNIGSASLKVTDIRVANSSVFTILSAPPIPFDIAGNSNMKVIIGANPTGNGLVTDSLIVKALGVPDSIKIVKLSVNVILPITTTATNINFGKVLISESPSDNISVQTNTDRPIIKVILVPPTASVKVDKPDTLRIGSQKIPIHFNPTKEGLEYDTVKIIVGTSCQDTLSIPVTANVPYTLQVSLDKFVIPVGEYFDIPLRFKGFLPAVESDTITATITFDKFLMDVQEVRIGTDIVPFVFDHKASTVTVVLNKTMAAKIGALTDNSGMVFTMKTLALASTPDTTTLHIQSCLVSASPKLVIMSKSDGSLEVTKFCKPAYQPLMYITGFSAQIAKSVPPDFTLKLNVQSTAEQALFVELFDVFGKSLERLNIQAQAGDNEVNFRQNEMPSGVYFVRVSSLFDVQILKAAVVK